METYFILLYRAATLIVSSIEEAERIYAALSDGGEIFVQMQGAFSQRTSDDILISVMQRFGLFLICICAVALQPGTSVMQIAGAPLKGKLGEPFSTGFDLSGNLYICEHQGQRITREGRDGGEQRFAGTGVKGFSGDGGPAASAQLNDPHSISTARTGMYIADTMNHRVRKVSWATGVITTIAGNGTKGFSGGGGPALKAAI